MKLKQIKKSFLELIVILVLLTTCFVNASVVSDNDGSAFITKAEFDSLKNNFQSQVDQYNNNIDAKIDSAISSYLAGIKTELTETLTNYNKKMYDNNVDNVKFINYGTSAAYPSTINNIYGEFALYCSRSQTTRTNVNNGKWWMIRFSTGGTYGGDNEWYDFGTQNAYYLINLNDTIADSTVGGKALSLAKTSRYYDKWKIKHETAGHSVNDNTFPTDSATWLNGMTKSFNVNIENEGKVSGIFQDSEVRDDFSFSGGDIKFTSTLGEEWVEYSDSATSKKKVGFMSSGQIPSQNLHCIEYLNRSIYNGTQVTFDNMHNVGGVIRYYYFNANTDTGLSMAFDTSVGTWPTKLTIYNHKIYDIPVTKLINVSASGIVSKPVYFYMGLPMTEVTKEGEVTMKARFFSDSGNNVKLTITDLNFNNTATPETWTYTKGGVEYDHVLYKGTHETGKTYTIKFKKNAVEKSTETLWYRLADDGSADEKVYMVVDDITLKYNN